MSETPTPVQEPAAPPAPAPGKPLLQALPYIAASIIFALTQGLGQGFVSVNIPQIAGDLGITTTDASWLMAAYMIPRATLPVLLIKIRTQFGLRRFAEVGIVAYLLVSVSALWIFDLRSAIVVQALSGIASAPLSTLAFLYMLEPLSQQWKMRLGLPMALAFISVGPLLARVISPDLIGDGGLTWVHLVALGLAMVALALVFRLPLTPVPHMKVIQGVDFVSFGLLTIGFGGLIIGCIMNPVRQPADAPSKMPLVTTDDNAPIVIQSKRALEFRCGKASMVMKADGTVTIRGTQILTRAERSNRVQGATVLLN